MKTNTGGYVVTKTPRDRAIGAIMGAFVGEALGVGPHWYYDLQEMQRNYGDWIDDYTTPRPGRFHHGLKAGQSAQARREFLAWGESLNRRRSPEKLPVNVYFTTLTFNQVEDPARREKYHGLPTAALDADEVDALIGLGGELLQQSEPFQKFLADMKPESNASGGSKTGAPP